MNVSVCSVLLSLSGTFLIFCGVAEGESSSLISRFVLVFSPSNSWKQLVAQIKSCLIIRVDCKSKVPSGAYLWQSKQAGKGVDMKRTDNSVAGESVE